MTATEEPTWSIGEVSDLTRPDYAQLVLEGDGNEANRLEILRQHEANVQQQVTDLQEALDIIHHKVELYTEHLRAGTAAEVWRHGPEC